MNSPSCLLPVLSASFLESVERPQWVETGSPAGAAVSSALGKGLTLAEPPHRRSGATYMRSAPRCALTDPRHLTSVCNQAVPKALWKRACPRAPKCHTSRSDSPSVGFAGRDDGHVKSSCIVLG